MRVKAAVGGLRRRNSYHVTQEMLMTVWQHAWISVDPMKPEDITKLEGFGKEGWELVSVIPWGQTAGIFLMFFKRPAPEATSQFG